MPNVHEKGDLVRVTGVFKDLAGNLIDPTTVKFIYTKPSGTQVTVTYPAAPITRNSVGNYHIEYALDEYGEWHHRWENSGTGQAMQPGTFMVEGKA